ncbi:hypothetical protein TNCV_4429571 [Trichonephila clavipes]|nr:hypothetical protein TNCV_4429571 [Trichonephila clavipes]
MLQELLVDRVGIMLTSQHKVARGTIGNGPRNFKPPSGDEDNTRPGTPFPNYPTAVHIEPPRQIKRAWSSVAVKRSVHSAVRNWGGEEPD